MSRDIECLMRGATDPAATSVEYARVFPEMDKLKGLRCAKCDRKIDLKEGLRQWPMSMAKDRFVCMDCEFELQMENRRDEA